MKLDQQNHTWLFTLNGHERDDSQTDVNDGNGKECDANNGNGAAVGKDEEEEDQI